MPINRRKFIEASAFAGGMGFINPFGLTKSKVPLLENASIKILATNWGFKGTTDEFCAKAKESGYDGIEVWWPRDEKTKTELLAALDKHELEVGLLAGQWTSDFSEHFEGFKKAVEEAVSLKPLFVNCHSGKDYFSFEQSRKILESTFEVSERSGVKVLHETHRGRILFAAHIAKRFMETLPELRLTLDISHWCNVHESLLLDQPEAVNLALSRTDHIHSRVGHPESPQVTDPRAPEWENAVKAHFEWWDKVVAMKAKNGKTLTMTTEFGPPTYMATVPFTNQPLANLWDVNTYMLKIWRERYQ